LWELLCKVVRRKSSTETIALEAMIVRGWSKREKKKQGSLPDQNKRERIVRKNVGTAIKLDTSRRTVGNKKNLITQRRKQIQLI